MTSQELADKPVKRSEKEITLINKFKVTDNIANVTSEKFVDIFSESTVINQLKKLGVTKIHIASGDVDMDFELPEASPDLKKWKNASCIGTRDVLTHGVIQAAALEKKLIILNCFGIVGFLQVNKTNPALARVGANRNHALFNTISEGQTGVMNANAVFKDSETLAIAAFQHKDRGGVKLTHLFENKAGQSEFLEVGKLLHPDLLSLNNIDFDSLQKTQIPRVKKMLAALHVDNQQELTSAVFKNAVHGYALYAGLHQNNPPLAILIPPTPDLT